MVVFNHIASIGLTNVQSFIGDTGRPMGILYTTLYIPYSERGAIMGMSIVITEVVISSGGVLREWGGYYSAECCGRGVTGHICKRFA